MKKHRNVHLYLNFSFLFLNWLTLILHIWAWTRDIKINLYIFCNSDFRDFTFFWNDQVLFLSGKWIVAGALERLNFFRGNGTLHYWTVKMAHLSIIFLKVLSDGCPKTLLCVRLTRMKFGAPSNNFLDKTVIKVWIA